MKALKKKMKVRSLSIFPGGKDGQCIGLTALPPSCADCLWNLGASTSWNSQGLSGHV